VTGPRLWGRRLLVLALLLGLGLAGAVGFQVWKRRQPIRAFAEFPLSNWCRLAFPDESTLVAFWSSESPDVVHEAVHSIGGDTAALITETWFETPNEHIPPVLCRQRALCLSDAERVLRVRSLPAFQELGSIKLQTDSLVTRTVPLSERLVALIYTHYQVEESRLYPRPTLVDVYDVEKGSLVGRVERKDLAAEIAPGDGDIIGDQDPHLDRDGDRLHLLLEGGIWVEWSLAAKRATRVRRLPSGGEGVGLSSEGELLLAEPGAGLSPYGREIVACPPDEGKEPRRIAPGLLIPGIYAVRDHAIVSPSGDRIVILTSEPEGSAYVVEVATSRRWRLAPSPRSLLYSAGAFSPSGERVALVSVHGGLTDFRSVELFQLPP
jgi:hypothetical protein